MVRSVVGNNILLNYKQTTYYTEHYRYRGTQLLYWHAQLCQCMYRGIHLVLDLDMQNQCSGVIQHTEFNRNRGTQLLYWNAQNDYACTGEYNSDSDKENQYTGVIQHAEFKSGFKSDAGI